MINTSLTKSQLQELKSSEIVALYNEIAGQMGDKPVKKFADKSKAVERTWTYLQRYKDATAHEAPKKKEKAAPKRKTRIMRFNFVPDDKTEVRQLKNTSTLRGRCVELLKKGATFTQVEELVEEFDKDTDRKSHDVTRRAYELVRIMHYWLGYGIRHDIESGIIKLYIKK